MKDQAEIRRENWLLKFGWCQRFENWIDPKTRIRYISSQAAQQVEKQRQRRLGKPRMDGGAK